MDTVQHTLNILLDFFFFLGWSCLVTTDERHQSPPHVMHGMSMCTLSLSLSIIYCIQITITNRPKAPPSHRDEHSSSQKRPHSFIHFILFYRQSIHPPVITGMPTSFSSVVRQIRDSALMDRR